MSSEDKRLGMHRPITRREFMDGALKLGAGAAVSSLLPGQVKAGEQGSPAAYPPGQAGLRGSHAGAFEVAHQLAWEGRRDWGQPLEDDPAEYDLVVVGAGISGLAAAWFYRQQHPDARVLILENHDDFGGHAKRNEFQVGGQHIIGYGGSQSLESPSAYSETAAAFLRSIGVDTEQLRARYDEDFYQRHNLASSIYFDREHYGVDKLVRSEFLDADLFLPLAQSGVSAAEAVNQMPISAEARAVLLKLLNSDEDSMPDASLFNEPGQLSAISYLDFIRDYHGVTHEEVITLLRDLPSSYFGHGIDMIPALDALGFGLPGLKGTSLGMFESPIRKLISWLTEPYLYHFPDGNASVARLIVRQLIPQVAGGDNMDDVVKARFDYSQLDRAGNATRLRLNSTVVRVEHKGRSASAAGVEVDYVRGGTAHRVRAKNVVLACYNMAIPHLCPTLPETQKAALKKLVKTPLVYSNVVLNNWRSLADLGIGMAYSPQRWHQLMMVDFPVSMGGYDFSPTPDDPVVLHLNRSVTSTGATPEEQSRAGRYELLAMSFEDYERELRRHLTGMLAEGGFDPAKDIAGITVNRWPHGYAWAPNALFDDYAEGEEPHVLGRKPFGHIAIANSDAGARAYLDCAIDEAARAVEELG